MSCYCWAGGVSLSPPDWRAGAPESSIWQIIKSANTWVSRVSGVAGVAFLSSGSGHRIAGLSSLSLLTIGARVTSGSEGTNQARFTRQTLVVFSRQNSECQFVSVARSNLRLSRYIHLYHDDQTDPGVPYRQGDHLYQGTRAFPSSHGLL